MIGARDATGGNAVVTGQLLLYLDKGRSVVTGALTRSGRSSKARYIGNQLSLPVQLQVNRHLTYTVFYSRFFAGRYLKESPPGRSVTYVSTFITYKF